MTWVRSRDANCLSILQIFGVWSSAVSGDTTARGSQAVTSDVDSPLSHDRYDSNIEKG